MNKTLLIMIGVYFLVFVSIFIFSSLITANEGESSSSLSDIGLIIKSVFSDIWSDVSSVDLESKISDVGDKIENASVSKYVLPTSCVFSTDFECMIFAPNKEKKELLFNIKNDLGKNVIIDKVVVSDGIECMTTLDQRVDKNKDFYVKLFDCNITDIEGKLRVYHYDLTSSKEFLRSSEARIIIK